MTPDARLVTSSSLAAPHTLTSSYHQTQGVNSRQLLAPGPAPESVSVCQSSGQMEIDLIKYRSVKDGIGSSPQKRDRVGIFI